jgi:hypothetical protein
MLELKRLLHGGVRIAALAGLLTSLWLVAAPAARADTAIAGDLESVVPLAFDDVEFGPAFAIRLGWQLHLPLITLTPEAGFHYASFDEGPNLYRGIIGGRVGVGELLRFGVFAHLGIARQTWTLATKDVSHTGLTIDAGLFLDLTIIPLIDIGVHMGYGRVGANEDENLDPMQWLAFGLHAALII